MVNCCTCMLSLLLFFNYKQLATIHIILTKHEIVASLNIDVKSTFPTNSSHVYSKWTFLISKGLILLSNNPKKGQAYKSQKKN
ncbi:hypothetical protein O6H91_09G092200 [Diphasiastrum complanatum]|uniref:Uncharacterized protein n=1 Tax=Diphasiastrum complanatum TaxID=34168 RepID=A0ACC2CS65_DIPCM|nr:hypothetical protein O6H91_09G092200 [Diphasiastrum complanatum]